MGCGASQQQRKYFVPDASRPGQGQAAVADFERLRIRKGDLDGFFNTFVRMDVKRRGCVELPAFYRFMGITPSVFADRVFAIFDEGGDGLIDFHEFVITVWNYCSLDSSALVRFAFMMYDQQATGFVEMADLRDMVRQMFGDRYTSNRRVMGIFGEVGFGDRISYDHFVEVYRKYPYLLFPAFLMQSKVRRAVMGEAFWEGQYQERTRRGNAATYSVFDVLEAMRVARIRTDGGEMQVALRNRYVPRHLVGHPGAAAAAELGPDPPLKGQLRRAELGLPPAAGDPDFGLEEARQARALQAGGAGGSRSSDGTGDPASGNSSGAGAGAGVVSAAHDAADPLANVKTLHGKKHETGYITTGPQSGSGGEGGAKGRRASRLANAQERAALMALGR